MFFSVQTSSRRATVLSLRDFFLLIELSLIRFNNCSLVLKIALAASLDKSLNSSVLSVSNNCVRFSGDLTLLKRVSYACSISGDFTSFGSCLIIRHEIESHLEIRTIHLLKVKVQQILILTYGFTLPQYQFTVFCLAPIPEMTSFMWQSDNNFSFFF